MVDAALAASSN